MVPCLAEAGAIVARSARRAEWVAWLVETAEAQGGKALALPGDMSKEADPRAAVLETVKAFGRIDIFVNSSGMMQASASVTPTLSCFARKSTSTIWARSEHHLGFGRRAAGRNRQGRAGSCVILAPTCRLGKSPPQHVPRIRQRCGSWLRLISAPVDDH